MELSDCLEGLTLPNGVFWCPTPYAVTTILRKCGFDQTKVLGYNEGLWPERNDPLAPREKAGPAVHCHLRTGPYDCRTFTGIDQIQTRKSSKRPAARVGHGRSSLRATIEPALGSRPSGATSEPRTSSPSPELGAGCHLQRMNRQATANGRSS